MPGAVRTACVLGINQPAVTIKQVEVTTIEQAFDAGAVTPQPPERLSGKTVAVIGSGPAGLAAAQQLTRAGHTVAVYERGEKPGGLLRYGIPSSRWRRPSWTDGWPRWRPRAPGSEAASTSATRSPGSSWSTATTRSSWPSVRRCPVTCGPGPELDGVHQAMEYLPQGNLAALGRSVPDQILATDRDVVIIGGGDTGAGLPRHRAPAAGAVGHPAGDHAAAHRGAALLASPGRRTR